MLVEISVYVLVKENLVLNLVFQVGWKVVDMYIYQKEQVNLIQCLQEKPGME